jgi:selenocysteine lyase/cysteine desulfurase
VRDWPDARRLDASTLSMTSLAGIGAALDWHQLQVGRGALAWASSLAGALRGRLAALPRVRLLPTEAPSTIVSFSLEGEPAEAVVKRLDGAGVVVRSIPGLKCVRASVGFWNDEGDLDALERALRGA